MTKERPAHREAKPTEIINRLRKITEIAGSSIPKQILVVEPHSKLTSDLDLEHLVRRLSHAIGLSSVPDVRFGLTPDEVAGTYSASSNLITVSTREASDQTVCATVAHELAHAWMNERSMSFSPSIENEKMTELVSVWIGLGLYVLNGCDSQQNLGYLDQQAIAFAFVVQCLLSNQDIPPSLLSSGASVTIESMWISRYGMFLRKRVGSIGAIEDLYSDFIRESKSEFERLELELSGALAEVSLTQASLKTLEDGCHRVLQDLTASRLDLESDPYGYFFESSQDQLSQFLIRAQNFDRLSYSLIQAVDAAHKNAGVPLECNTLVIKCPLCAAKLRLPNVDSDLSVHCPSCKSDLNTRAKVRKCLSESKMNLFKLALSADNAFDSRFRESLAKLAFDPNASLPEENSFRSRLFEISLHRELPHTPHDTRLRNALFELSVGEASNLPEEGSLADQLLCNSLSSDFGRAPEAEDFSEYLSRACESQSVPKFMLRKIIHTLVRIANSI